MSATAVFTIGEVAAMVGMTQHAIRAWERRHALLSPERSPSNQRRYSAEDVELIRRVRQNVALRGMSLKLAVKEALGELPDAPLLERPEAPPEPAAEAAGQVPWRAVADLLPELAVVLDRAGLIADSNIAFARAAGILRGGLRGRPFTDLVLPHDRAKAVSIYRPQPRQRRGWELNLKTPMLSGLYSFDCWPLPGGLVALLGRSIGGSGLELWSGNREAEP